MPNQIALHDDPDFDALLAAAAAQVNAPLSVVIKDYWLTEALAVLSRATDFRVIFKGGTSLSKGWHLIDRFSEDIDLLVASSKDDIRLGQAARRRDTSKESSQGIRERLHIHTIN